MASLSRTWQRVTRNDQLLLFFLAVLVGTAAGYGALLLRVLSAAIQLLFLGTASARARSRWWSATMASARSRRSWRAR